jgi:hypothetical protein
MPNSASFPYLQYIIVINWLYGTLCSEGKGDLMSIEISKETETRLAAEARRLGISEDALLARFLSEHATLTKPPQAAATLPVWHLGGVGALHRRDIYADVG